MVKDKYSDYYNDDDGKSFYIGNSPYQFRQKENEKDMCTRISVIKAAPYVIEGEDTIFFYHFDIIKDAPEMIL